MLTICVGPNGSGKSLWAMHQLEHALMEDERPIVTSLAIDIGALNEYMQRKYKDKAPDVVNRVCRIDKEQMRTFWRVRGVEHDGEYGFTPIMRGSFGDHSWNLPDPGVVYILDEVQTTFGARDWQKTGQEFVTYQSQHRKLGDDVIAISPSSSLIEKQFRILAGECVILTNLYKLRVGIMKAPRRIVYRLYQNCPPAPGEDEFAKGNLYIDAKGLASCYRTQEGLGICGQQADIGREAKGIPWIVIFPIIAVCCVVAWLVLSNFTRWGANSAARRLAIAKGTPPPQLAHTNTPAAPSPAPLMGGFGNVRHPETPPPPPPVSNAPPVLPRDLPKAYGWARTAPGAFALETELGLIRGTNLIERGRFYQLDGDLFARARRPKDDAVARNP